MWTRRRVEITSSTPPSLKVFRIISAQTTSALINFSLQQSRNHIKQHLIFTAGETIWDNKFGPMRLTLGYIGSLSFESFVPSRCLFNQKFRFSSENRLLQGVSGVCFTHLLWLISNNKYCIFLHRSLWSSKIFNLF